MCKITAIKSHHKKEINLLSVYTAEMIEIGRSQKTIVDVYNNTMRSVERS